MSQQMNLLKFCCTVGIVCMHTSYTSVPVGNGDLMVMGMDWIVFVNLLRVGMRVCVPMFFLLSGFLFVSHGTMTGHESGVMGHESWEWYKGKFMRRVKSLMVPYMVANVVVYLCFNVGNLLMQGLMKSGNSYCVYSSWTDYVLMFWTPANSVMWFLRDLIIVTFLSPVILPLVKWTRGVVVLLFGVLWYFGIWKSGYDGFSGVSFFFFYLGATIGLMGHESWVKGLGRKGWIRWALRVVCVMAICSWWYCGLISHTLISDHTYILTSVVLAICLVTKVSDSRLSFFDSRFWMPACFFIYAYHSMIQIPMKKGLYVLIRPENPIWNYAIYFSTVAFTIAFLAGVYWVMKKVMGGYSWVFTGR